MGAPTSWLMNVLIERLTPSDVEEEAMISGQGPLVMGCARRVIRMSPSLPHAVHPRTSAVPEAHTISHSGITTPRLFVLASLDGATTVLSGAGGTGSSACSIAEVDPLVRLGTFA
jgi:hypothetical protein